MTWKTRSQELEQMDIEPMDAATAAPVLSALETVNQLLGGANATLGHLERFSKCWKPGERIRLIDWGTGAADIPRAIVRWARERGFRVEIVGIDNNPAVEACARELCRDFPEIRIIREDAEHFEPEQPFDYAISSLTLHHLTDEHVVSLLKKSDRLARRGMILNDLIRSRRAWAWITFLVIVLPVPPIFRHDAPLSVRRAFTPEELEALALQAGCPYLRTRKHFGYRQTLAGEKPAAAARL